MTAISINDLKLHNFHDKKLSPNLLVDEECLFRDLSSDEVNLARGGGLWWGVAGIAWLGYEIGKEAKTNWFA